MLLILVVFLLGVAVGGGLWIDPLLFFVAALAVLVFFLGGGVHRRW